MGHMLNGEQLAYYLRTVHADRDADGRPILSGLTVSFLGAGQDYVIGDDARYYVDGQPRGLAIGLRGTSYGMKVTVI